MLFDDPEMFYLALVLPGLFALTLVIEGVHKILKEESGWMSLIFGIVFLVIIVVAYFFLLR